MENLISENVGEDEALEQNNNVMQRPWKAQMALIGDIDKMWRREENFASGVEDNLEKLSHENEAE